jgi:hypothetical protein
MGQGVHPNPGFFHVPENEGGNSEVNVQYNRTLFYQRIPMVCMDLPTAVKSYQFGERAKSELIISSQLSLALTGFSEAERAGGKRMLLLLLESVRSELQFAARSTGQGEFQKAITSINDAISLIESSQPEQASEKIAAAISASTTPAQNAWQVLSEHGLI